MRLGLAVSVLFGCLCGWSTLVDAASSSCAKFQTKPDQLVCESAELRTLDQQFRGLYRQLLQHPKAESEKIKTAQQAWRETVRDACDDAACLKTVYSSGIASLQASLKDLGPKSARSEDSASARASGHAAKPGSTEAEAAASSKNKRTATANANKTQRDDAGDAPDAEPGNLSIPSWLLGSWSLNGDRCQIEVTSNNWLLVQQDGQKIKSRITGIEATLSDVIIYTPEAVSGFERVGPNVLRPLWIEIAGQRRRVTRQGQWVKCR